MKLLTRPLIVLTLSTLAAVAAAQRLGAPENAALGWALAGAVAALCGAIFLGERRARYLACVGIFGGVLLVGGSSGPPAGVEQLGAAVGEGRLRAVVAGTVRNQGPRSPRGYSVDVDVSRVDRLHFDTDPPHRDRPRVRLFVPVDPMSSPHAPALVGDRIEVFARLERYPPRAFARLRPTRRRMAGRGLYFRATALEPVEVLGADVGLRAGIGRRLARARDRLEQRLIDGLDPEHAALAVALTTGNRSYLEPRTVEPFRRTGTSHLLAISGLHLGVLAALLWWVMGLIVNRVPWLLRRFGRRRVCGLAVLAILGAYVVAIGAPVSAVRALVAVGIGIGALMLLRPVCAFHALAAAALGLVVMQPSVVSEFGFQLSFGATLGILLFLRHRPAVLEPSQSVFGEPEPPGRRRLRKLGLFVGVSTSATLATWPILAAHLGEVPAAGLVVNLVVTPLVSAVLFPVLVAGVVASLVFEPLGLFALRCSLDGLLAVRQGLVWAAQWRASVWVTGALSWWAVAAMGTGAFVAVISRWRAVRLGVAVVLLAAGLSPALASAPAQSTGELRVHFIPVGQGDATLVEFPDGATMLIDGGGTRFGRDPGRLVVVPYLRRLGIERLDWVVVTHSDADHLHGLFAVCEALSPRRLVFDAADEEASLARLRRQAASRGTQLVALEHSLAREFGGARVEIVRPKVRSRSRNDASLVARLSYATAAVLLPGDVEEPAERWLVEHRHLRATVLKAPHHGSKTSSSGAFVDAVAPSVALVSAGRFSHFGHPHAQVLSRYRQRGVRVFETAHQGLVRVDIAPTGKVSVRSVRSVH